MKTFSCRYFEPNGIPAKNQLETCPDGMKGWLSGYCEDDTIWCARVDAESAGSAEAIIRSCYGKSGKRIVIDFIEEMPLGWRPGGDRFPE